MVAIEAMVIVPGRADTVGGFAIPPGLGTKAVVDAVARLVVVAAGCVPPDGDKVAGDPTVPVAAEAASSPPCPSAIV